MVAGLLEFAAVMLEPDEVVSELAAEYPMPLSRHTTIHDDGTFSVDPDGAIESFHRRCEEGPPVRQ